MLAPKVFVTQTVDKEPYNIDFVPVMIDGSGTAINNSEIEGDFVCDSVKEISASYLENVKLESLDKVESCYLSAYIYENKEKRSNLINVNSNEEKKLPNDTKLEIL
jgi:hypothetical protein